MSGSYYTLNAKYNSLLALFNSFFPYPPSPYPPPSNVMTLSTAQTATGLKTFSVLPQSSVVPLANDDFTNKLYVDTVGATPNLQAVLAVGNDSILDIVLKDTLVAPTATNTIANDSLAMSNIVAGTSDSEILIDNPTFFSEFRTSFNDITNSAFSVGSLKSQPNQTDYTTSVTDSVNNLTGTKTLITIGGAILDTDTATNSATGAVATSSRTSGWSLGANTAQTFNTGTGLITGYTANVGSSEAETELTFLSPTFDIKYNASSASGGSAMSATSLEIGTGLNCLRQESTAYLALNDLHLSNSDTGITPARQVSYSTQINQTNALVAQNYNDTTLGIVNSLSQFANATTSEDVVQYSDNQFNTSAKINAEAGVARKVISATALSGGANSIQAESVTNNGYNNVIVSKEATVPTLLATKTEQISAGVQSLSLMDYTDNTNNIFTQTQTTMNGSGSSAFYGASNTLASDSHLLRLEVPVLGDARIEHTVIGSNRNLNMTTDGNFLMGSDNLDITANNLSFTTASAGGAGLPNLTLNNTGNSASGVCLEVFKDRPSVANGDVLFQESIYGRDSAGNKQEYTRITHTIRDRTSGAEDGSMELGCVTNGSYANFIQLNANDTPIGEVNMLRPLDFIGGSDANSTIKTSGTGSVNLNIDATSSAGTGAIALKTKNGTPGSGGGLLLTGDTLLSATAGGNSGQHLCLTIGGTVYKIQLLNP
jgi:hypothetical protein